MLPRSKSALSRRRLLAAMLAIPAVALVFRLVRPSAHPELVEVDGWILKRSDLEGDQA